MSDQCTGHCAPLQACARERMPTVAPLPRYATVNKQIFLISTYKLNATSYFLYLLFYTFIFSSLLCLSLQMVRKCVGVSRHLCNFFAEGKAFLILLLLAFSLCECQQFSMTMGSMCIIEIGSWAGVELPTSRLQVRQANHYTLESALVSSDTYTIFLKLQR